MEINLLKNGAVENTAVADATKFLNSGSGKHRFRNKLVALFVFVFLFGAANISAFEIWDQNDWDLFVDEVENYQSSGRYYNLMVNVGTPGSPIAIVTQPIVGSLQGFFNGNNNQIIVNISSNATNVGLFSEVRGGYIVDLVVDGFVTGGPDSENVGGFAGLAEAIYFQSLTNLSDVTGTSPNSSVGGILGTATNGDSEVGVIVVNFSINNGSIAGGRYVAGIVGKISNCFSEIHTCKNAGIIKSFEDFEPEYMAGILAFADSDFIGGVGVFFAVNIGMILSSSTEFAGGVAGYVGNGGAISSSSNAGFVDGARGYVGGVAGFMNSIAFVYDCINTNWVNRGSASRFGSILGFNNGAFVIDCYYDNQMSILGGIDNVDIWGEAVGLLTNDMINNLPFLLPAWAWDFQNNLYPRPTNGSGSPNNHPIALLSAAPIYLQNNPATGRPETLNEVTQNFFVANNIWIAPGVGNPYSFEYPYQWGSFMNLPAGGWVHLPFSVNGNIIVPPPPSIDANIVGSGPDSLVVRIPQWYYNLNYPFYPLSYNVIFEKVVPINVP